MATDLTVTGFEDRPGVTAGIGEALGQAGVNIDGGFGHGRAGEIHVLVEDADAARGALEGAGYQVSDEREALVVDAENRPGALGANARKLADAGVNIAYHYVGADNRLVFVVDDHGRGREALGA